MNLWISLLFISLVDLNVGSTNSAYCKTKRFSISFVLFKLIALNIKY